MSQRGGSCGDEPGWIGGSCHCGRVAFAVRGAPTQVLVCNCSICTRKGYLHWIVPSTDFCMECDEGDLSVYRFGTGVAKHWFCPVCGCSPFYVPRSDPDKIDVNVRCLDDVDLGALEVETFDGQHWEHHFETVYRKPPG